MLTKEQFIAQFPDRISNIESLKARNLVQPYIGREEPYPGVKLYCALNKVLIEVNGQYFVNPR